MTKPTNADRQARAQALIDDHKQINAWDLDDKVNGMQFAIDRLTAVNDDLSARLDVLTKAYLLHLQRTHGGWEGNVSMLRAGDVAGAIGPSTTSNTRGSGNDTVKPPTPSDRASRSTNGRRRGTRAPARS